MERKVTVYQCTHIRRATCTCSYSRPMCEAICSLYTVIRPYINLYHSKLSVIAFTDNETWCLWVVQHDTLAVLLRLNVQGCDWLWEVYAQWTVATLLLISFYLLLGLPAMRIHSFASKYVSLLHLTWPISIPVHFTNYTYVLYPYSYPYWSFDYCNFIVPCTVTALLFVNWLVGIVLTAVICPCSMSTPL